MKPETDDVWTEQRWYWRNRDLPALAGDVGKVVLAKTAEKMERRAALDAITTESERLGLYGRRWSVEDEG
ncbi:MAG: hypothetical protein WC869_11905 [Phycisphaerae bacterium]